MSEQCPYCEEDIDIDDGGGHRDGKVYESHCPHCDRNFVFTVKYAKAFFTQKADCLNGDPHDWKKVISYPHFVTVGQYRCTSCGREEVRMPERMTELRRIFNEPSSDRFDRELIGRWIQEYEAKEVKP